MKFLVTVHPRAKLPQVVKNGDESLDVYVKEPAKEGKANEAVVKALAKFFGVKKSSVLLLKGLKGKRKLAQIINPN